MVGSYTNVIIKGIATDCFDKGSGMLERRTSQTTVSAAKRLMSHLKWEKDCIRVLILVTQNPDFVFPATAFYIQQQLDIGNDCMVYDINLGTNGYPVGIQLVSALLQPYGLGSKGILLSGDKDTGTATAIELDEHNQLCFCQESFPFMYNKIWKRSYKDEYYIDQKENYEFMQKNANLCKEEWKSKNVDRSFFPQLDYQAEDFVDSPVLIPQMICKNIKGQKKETVTCLCFGYGAGISVGSACFELESNGVLQEEVVKECDF